MPTQYDIVIVGAGLVGASLTCALQTQNCRVAIIDVNPLSIKTDQSNGFTTRALVLNYRSQLIFTDMGIWPKIFQIAQAVTMVHVSDQKRFGSVRITAEQMQVKTLGVVVPADQLLTIVQNKMLAGNVDVFAPAKVRTIQQDEASSLITIEYEQKNTTLSTKLLIGADGNHSQVRSLLGIHTATHDYQESALLGTLKLTRSHHNTAYERFTQTGPIAMLPLANNCAKYVWVVPNWQATEKMALAKHEFLEQLQRCFGYRLGKFSEFLSRTTYPLTSTLAQPQAIPGAILLGNAAHSFHPVGAQGFNLGLRDVATLVDVLTEHLANGQALNDVALIEQYLTRSRHYQQGIMNATDQLTKVFTSDFFPVRLGRNVAMNTMNVLPLFKKRLAKTFMGI